MSTQRFGRGGAGNVTTRTDQSPGLPPTGTPTLKSKNYTTGRGGQGNIVEYKDAETARAAQDVDVPGIALHEGDYHIGRGGGGNVHKATEEELAATRENNKTLRQTSFTKDRSSLKGLAEKAKDLVKGSHKEEN